MTIDDVINAFGSVFSLMWSARLVGMPLMFWLLLIAVFSIVASFIKGGKGN